MKRYVAEPGSDVVRAAMQRAEGWFMCRVGFIETFRAVALAAGRPAARRFQKEWPAFGVLEVDEELSEQAAQFTVKHGLRSLDALHLAAVVLLPREQLVVTTWDRGLHAAALEEHLSVLPDMLADL